MSSLPTMPYLNLGNASVLPATPTTTAPLSFDSKKMFESYADWMKTKEQPKKYDVQYYNSNMPEPTPEEQRRRDIQNKNVAIVTKFDEYKMKFNDVMSYEHQALNEKDAEQRELFKTMFFLRLKKLREFSDGLWKEIDERMGMQLPAESK